MTELDSLLQIIQVIVTFLLIIIPGSAHWESNPLYSRTRDGFEKLQKFRDIREEVERGELSRGDRGFRIILQSIRRNRSLSGKVEKIFLEKGDSKTILDGGVADGTPSIAGIATFPNASLSVEYADGDREVVIFRPTDSTPTLGLYDLERWVQNYLLEKTSYLTGTLALIWATLSILLL
ncbi:hypothetical protein [Halovivax limisalsi]|uniref:hypothetical protein n=1 Tax=Halovivax limisalsi TaxID=1453760 RepID=UPI001FFC4A1D|nr:hypothetical protein [Halovivax limisalsi]